MNKKGIELSINFVIILVLSLAVFFGGLAIAKQFFGKASNIKSTIDARTRQEIINLLDDGSPLAVPIQQLTIERGGYAATGVGVYNVLQADANFSLSIIPVSVGECNPTDNIEPTPLTANQKQVLSNTEKRVFDVVFKAEKNAKSCKYMFDVEVTYGIGENPKPTNVYTGNTPKIIVILD